MKLKEFFGRKNNKLIERMQNVPGTVEGQRHFNFKQF